MTKRQRPLHSFFTLATLLALAGIGTAYADGDEALRNRVAGMSIPFVANGGQTDPRVAYSAATFAGTVFVTRDGQIVYSLPGERERTPESRLPITRPGWTLTETPVGNRAIPRSGRPASTHVSYFVGSDPACWSTDLSTFERVSLGEPWPGISLELEAHGQNVEKLFTVSPGSDASRIRMRVAGADSLQVDGKGALVAATGLGDVTFTRPIAYQETDGARREVPVAYRAEGSEYGFVVGSHDPALPVVIDPILQSTYRGGSGLEDQYALAVNSTTGDVYVAGRTQSANFPGTTGGAQPAFAGLSDAFVARLNGALTSPIQATYLGGSGIEIAYSLVIEFSTGDVIVTGQTSSNDFPGTIGGAQELFGGLIDAFVARLNSGLTTLIQSTYVGGSSADFGFDILFTFPNFLIVGQTDSDDLPGTTGGAQPTLGGLNDGFASLVTGDLRTFVQSTYIGGTQADVANGAAFDVETNTVYVTGTTFSTDFPGTINGAQPALGGSNDAFVVRFNSNLTTRIQATYLGGSAAEYGHAVALDGSIRPFVVGQTGSTNFPGTAGGAQPTNAGGQDAFVSVLSTGLTAVTQSTYLGGGATENGYAIFLNFTSNEVFVAGDTGSNNFPKTAGGAQPTLGGGTDAFIARFNDTLTTLNQSTYLGGTAFELGGFELGFNPTQTEVYFGGGTTSTNFPVTAGGAQPTNAGNQDGFIARVTADLLGGGAALLSLSKTAPATVAPFANLTYTITYGNPGGADATGVFISDTLPANTTFVSATGGGTFASNVVTWNIGTVPAGSSGLTVTFTVQVTATSGTVDNLIYGITATNATPVNGAPVSTTVVAPTLSVIKTAPPIVVAGSNLTYTLTYTNNGTTDAPIAFLQDTVPTGTVFVSATGGGTLDINTVFWTVGPVPAGGSGSVTFTVQVLTTGPVDNVTYSISAPGVPAVPGPPLSTPVRSLTITKSAPANVLPGGNITYTITYGNVGAIAVNGVVISDPVPSGTTFVSASGGGVFGNGFVTWNIGTVPANTTGLTVTFTVNVTATSGSVVNTNYTIAGTGTPPVTGPAVTTTICGPPTAVASATQSSICPGSSTSLRGTGGSSCVWTPSTGLSNPNSCNPTASPTSTTTYSLRVSSLCGTSTNTARVTITVSAQPEGPVVEAPAEVVAGQFDLVASIVNPNPESTYAFAFTPPEAATITFQDADSIVFTANVSGPLTLSVTESNDSCVSEPTQHAIAVAPCPDPPPAPIAPQIQAAGNPDGPVTGVDFLDLSWTAPDPRPAFYLWAINGEEPQRASATSVLNVPPTGTNDAITLQVRSACSDEIVSDVATATQTPSPPEVAEFSVPADVTAGEPVTFTDTTENATSWLWLFGDRSFPGTTQSVVHTYAEPGIYTVWLFASNGAGTTSTRQLIDVSDAAPLVRVALQRTPFDATNPRRQRLENVGFSGREPRWLSIQSLSDAQETIVFLRFADAAGNLVHQRRLSIAPKQDATFDLNAYGVRGTYTVEVISWRPVTASILEPRARETREVRRPQR